MKMTDFASIVSLLEIQRFNEQAKFAIQIFIPLPTAQFILRRMCFCRTIKLIRETRSYRNEICEKGEKRSTRTCPGSP